MSLFILSLGLRRYWRGGRDKALTQIIAGATFGVASLVVVLVFPMSVDKLVFAGAVGAVYGALLVGVTLVDRWLLRRDRRKWQDLSKPNDQ